jgi:hypothetical protein
MGWDGLWNDMYSARSANALCLEYTLESGCERNGSVSHPSEEETRALLGKASAVVAVLHGTGLW